jgi:oxygen-independent coproporphyrinogen III oxidase
MSTLQVDLDLIKKYNVAGPRYTSYPPATHFTDHVSFDDIRRRIRANNEESRNLSLYFHLPFCRTLCWYCGCTTVITTHQNQSTTYLGYLKKEMELMGELMNPRRQAVQLHFGGGTPTFLTPDDLRLLGKMIHERFVVAPDVEAGVEIDPRRLTKDHVTALREIGFNRASIGVQDHNPEVQRAIHRIQPLEQTKQAVDWVREAGFQSVNMDLIYGLPHQTAASFEKTIDEVLRLKPDRFAVFSYAHVPWIKPAQRIFDDSALPSAEVKLELLKLTIEKLTAEGFVYIGMDHFARPDDELTLAQKHKTLQRNFQGYSTHGEADIYSFGMSSISQADGIYWQNIKDLAAYYESLDRSALPFAKGYVLTGADKIRRQTIMRLMCDLSLDYAAMSLLIGHDFKTYFAPELASLGDLEADGLIVCGGEGLTVTDTGRLLIRNIAMRFDAYQAARAAERAYSQTI